MVQNFAKKLAEIRLSPDLSTGQVLRQITNADVAGRFRIPTTLAEHGHRLAIVNSRLDLGLLPPLGTAYPPPPTTTRYSSAGPDPTPDRSRPPSAAA